MYEVIGAIQSLDKAKALIHKNISIHSYKFRKGLCIFAVRFKCIVFRKNDRRN